MNFGVKENNIKNMDTINEQSGSNSNYSLRNGYGNNGASECPLYPVLYTIFSKTRKKF